MKISKNQNKINLGNGVVLKAIPSTLGCTGCYFCRMPYHCIKAKCEEDARDDELDVIFVEVKNES